MSLVVSARKLNLQQFVEDKTEELGRVLDNYLAQNIQHGEVQRFVDSVFSDWEREGTKGAEPMVVGEKEFWCAVWATQHLATEDHWIDGVAQRELAFLLRVLKGEELLPASFDGRRP